MDQNNMNSQNMINETQSSVTDNGVATPVAPMPASEPASVERKRQWMMPTLIVCLVLALAGIGFGIYSTIKMVELNNTISNLQEQNSALIEQIEDQNSTTTKFPEAKLWASTEIRNGSFTILDKNGNVIMQSNADELTVNDISSCDSFSDNTVIKCTVQTSKGEGWFLYDAYGDSLESSFESD